jgi:hypothetical protein
MAGLNNDAVFIEQPIEKPSQSRLTPQQNQKMGSIIAMLPGSPYSDRADVIK